MIEAEQVEEPKTCAPSRRRLSVRSVGLPFEADAVDVAAIAGKWIVVILVPDIRAGAATCGS